MKKLLIIGCLLLSTISFSANGVNPKKLLFVKQSKIEALFLKTNCDATYEAMLEIADEILYINLAYPPNGANDFYYDSVAAQYSTALANASSIKRECNRSL